MFLPHSEGNEAAKDYFQRAIRRGALAHAYLLVGPDQERKFTFARELAKAFFCTAGLGCGECTPCASIEHGNHPNVNFYGPPEGKSLIDIETIRALCERTHYRSREVQVAVLEQAELMNEPAANALLKTLEEPPGETVIILTAQSVGSLLTTIVSRCHRVYLARAPGSNPPLPDGVAAFLDDVTAPGFFARQDPRSRLLESQPADSTKGALRALLPILIQHGRSRLDQVSGLDLDEALRRLAVIHDLAVDIERNVNPDLVLEKLLRTLRHGA